MADIYRRKYGTQTTITFDLAADANPEDLQPAATFATGDVKIMKDEAAEANTTNLPTDEGTNYSLVLTATEMQAARIVVTLIDQTATKVWMDKTIVIETYGHASAQHAGEISSASFATDLDVYEALVELGAADRQGTSHSATATDTLYVTFKKNGLIVANGSISSPEIHVVKAGAGTVIKNWTALTLVTNTDTYKCDITGSDLLASGDTYIVRVRGTIDSAVRTVPLVRAIGRDT